VSRPIVMCQEMSQYNPNAMDDTATSPDHANHGIVVVADAARECATPLRKLSSGTLACAIDASASENTRAILASQERVAPNARRFSEKHRCGD